VNTPETARARRPEESLLPFSEGRRAAVRMRELRRQAGLTQEQVAAMAGQSPSWVAKREQGGTRLSVAEAELIAKVLGTNLAGLTEETA